MMTMTVGLVLSELLCCDPPAPLAADVLSDAGKMFFGRIRPQAHVLSRTSQ
jgi:hypothetical protein